MNKILINCEMPLSMMDENLLYNEYDFVLFHLYDTNEEYRNYYLSLRKSHPERLMIFDNSAYEYYIMKKSFDESLFIKAVSELNPDYYIIPDVLMNQKDTVDNFLRFTERETRSTTPKSMIQEIYDNSKSLPMVVPQGKSMKEMLHCYNIMKDNKEFNSVYANSHVEDKRLYISIPFHNDFFWDIGNILLNSSSGQIYDESYSKNGDSYYSVGRVRFMDFLYSNITTTNVKFHMLGSHNPVEKIYLQRCHADIVTMDTATPIKCGYMGVDISNKEYIKPNLIIDQIVDISDSSRALIIKNIMLFRSW